MDSIEDMQLDFLDLFGVMVNGTEVPAFDQSGRRWYRLSALFQALELQGVGDGSLSSKPGNLFPNSVLRIRGTTAIVHAGQPLRDDQKSGLGCFLILIIGQPELASIQIICKLG